MRRFWFLGLVVLTVAGMGTAYALGRGGRPTTTESPVVSTTSAPLTTPAPPSADPTTAPDYPHRRADGRPLTPEVLARIVLVERFTRAMYERDYTLPWPGFSTRRVRSLSIGQGRAAAEKTIAAAPTKEAYSQAAGYTKRVEVVDLLANDDTTFTLVINTTDSAGVTTEVNLRATTVPCGHQECVATFDPFTTE